MRSVLCKRQRTARPISGKCLIWSWRWKLRKPRRLRMTWTVLDNQMAAWSARLVSGVKLSEADSKKIATTIAADVRFLPSHAKAEIAAATPVPIRDRLTELRAFQSWMVTPKSSPPANRAQVIMQNYICFVYLPESCFSVLSKILPSGSVSKKCAKFLCNDRIRSFRNAIAHANWTYREDFGAIIYWARKGDNDPSLTRFEVGEEELEFWQAFSRTVAYAAFSNLD